MCDFTIAASNPSVRADITNPPRRPIRPNNSLISAITVTSKELNKNFPIPPDQKYTGKSLDQQRWIQFLAGSFTVLIGYVLSWVRLSWTRLALFAGNVSLVFYRDMRSGSRRQQLAGLFGYTANLIWIMFLVKRIPWGSFYWYQVLVLEMGIPLIVTWLDCLLADGPPGRSDLILKYRFDALFGYGLTYVPLFAPRWVASTAFWTLHAFLDWSITFAWLFYAPGEIFYRSPPTWSAKFQHKLLIALTKVSLYLAVPSAILLAVAWVLTPSGAEWKSELYTTATARVGLWMLSIYPKLTKLWEFYSLFKAFVLGGLHEKVRSLMFDWVGQSRANRAALHQYGPLVPGQFRVIVLKRSFPGIPRASIVTVARTLDVEYEAISYRCADPTHKQSLYINGSRLSVPRSAVDALLARTSLWRERIIWLDAVCVNQDNAAEKATQVQMAREIYQNSSRVVVLPDVDWRSRLAVDLLYQHTSQSQLSALPDFLSDLQGLMQGKIPVVRNALDQVFNLIESTYWTRVWSLQEIACGQNVDVYLGGLYVPWTTLTRGVQIPPLQAMMAVISRTPQKAQVTVSGLQKIVQIAVASDKTAQQSHSTGFVYGSSNKLEALLHSSVRYQASEERDRMFAMRAVAKSHECLFDTLMQPSYSVSMADMCEEIARYFFFHSEKTSIHLLGFAGIGYQNTPRVSHSWVPELWYTSRECFNCPVALQQPRFRATKDQGPQISQPDERGRMLIRGAVCDSIVWLSELPEAPSVDVKMRDVQEWNRLLAAWLNSAIEFDDQRFHEMRADSRIEQALIADVDPNVTRETFRDWLRMFSISAQTVYDNDTARNSALLEATQLVATPGVAQFELYLHTASLGRRFGATRSGRYCLVPPLTQPGDEVVLLYGAQTPFVLRDASEEGEQIYKIVGEAYVQGIMQGEAMGSHPVQDFCII